MVWKPFLPPPEPNFILPPSNSTNPANFSSSSSEHQRILNLFYFGLHYRWVVRYKSPLNSDHYNKLPSTSANCYSKELPHYAHSELLDTAISPKMRSSLSSWSVLPVDLSFSFHRNLKDKYSLPMFFLLSSYSIKKRARRGGP